MSRGKNLQFFLLWKITDSVTDQALKQPRDKASY